MEHETQRAQQASTADLTDSDSTTVPTEAPPVEHLDEAEQQNNVDAGTDHTEQTAPVDAVTIHGSTANERG